METTENQEAPRFPKPILCRPNNPRRSQGSTECRPTNVLNGSWEVNLQRGLGIQHLAGAPMHKLDVQLRREFGRQAPQIP